jgi:hypothetical protein
MAVVTHGSFDEGPIVLALPPIFEGLLPDGLTTETDPVFTAWDRHTGITVSKSQITNRSDIITTDGGDGTTNISTIVTGSNTGDQNLTGLVPYTGATGNVNLGAHTLNVERAYANQETPISSTELATKGYADSLAFTGAGGITPTVAHNDTTGKEGGGGGHWYHLSDTANTVIPNITESGSDIVPLGLSLVTSGISLGLDCLAFVTLTWSAIVSNTFDHYSVEYKKSAYTYYTPLTTQSNTITIEGLTPNTSYNFRVASVNKYGTESAFCTDLIITTPADSVAPATVTGVSATQAIQAVLLRWTHNTDIDLDSYNIYRFTSNDSSSATLVANFKGNVYMDNGLTANTTYYYWLKAVDTSGNLSTLFSTECHATTKNVTASDIENIAAGQVIIQGVTTLANWVSPGVTTIDGANITTGTVTLSQLNFTPITGTNVIASINSSPEGIQIDADNFAVSGATTFTSKVGGSFTSANSVPRIRIFPNTDIGIEVVDDLGNNVFKAEVGGTNIGDVTIGNWAGNQGIKYDKSANNTSFAGTIMASAGNIGGWTINGTYLAKDTGTPSTSVGMSPSDYPFYAGATYTNRATAPFRVDTNGSVHVNWLYVDNLNDDYVPKKYTGGYLQGSLIKSTDRIKINGAQGLVIPVMAGSPSSPEQGMIYYDTNTGRMYLYTNRWYNISMT